ncbi:MAG: hypothetical protein KIC94_14025 [Clostridiales bacterium]|nr:hypothetical protein [Clostridiales bacterium]
MSRPDIGDAKIPDVLKNDKSQIKKLSVLQENAQESIYSLIFAEDQKGSIDKYE